MPASVCSRCGTARSGDARTETLSRSSCLQSFARSCRTLMLCGPDMPCNCRRCDAARDGLGAWHGGHLRLWLGADRKNEMLSVCVHAVLCNA